MKRNRLSTVVILLVLSLALAQSLNSSKLRAEDRTNPQSNARRSLFGGRNPQSARPQSKSPWINLRDGVDLRTTYIGSVGLKQVLEQNLAVPLVLASADFDEDGVPDLVSGYAGPSGGIITLHRGNIDSLWPQPQGGKGAGEQRSRGVEGPRSWKKDISLAPPHPSSPAPSLPSPPAPFLPSADVFETPDPPDFLGAGDFDADGHWDVVTAARGSDHLQFLRGNGRGELQSARAITLPGAVTAMVTGEINRRDGLDDVIVGIVGRDSPQVLVFEWPEGALRGEPEVIPIPAEATGLALGQLDESYEMDLAVAAGTELLLVSGRDRRLSWDEAHRAEVKSAAIDQRSFVFTIRSLALGDFIADSTHQTDIALLADDGAIHVLARSERSEAGATVRAALRGRPRVGDRQSNAGAHGEAPVQPPDQGAVRASVSGRPRLGDGQSNAGAHGEAPVQPSVRKLKEWRSDTLTTNSWPQATRLFAVKTSSLPTDDLIVLDPASHQLHVLMTGDEPQSAIHNPQSAIGRSAIRNPQSAAPVAVLPMRLNVDALNDLVILRTGQSAPTVAMTAAGATIMVNSTADTAVASDGKCTLREAINNANSATSTDTTGGDCAAGTAGADMIEFKIPATDPGCTGTGVCTIRPTSPLPAITQPVTIDGYTQPGAQPNTLAKGDNAILRIELNGTNAGTGTNCLTISSGLSTVRGLVINRFPGSTAGIELTAGSNIIEGNFIGTNVSGTTALGNGGDSVVTTTTAPGNTIGGTVPEARNVLSVQNSDGVEINSNGNMVWGNYIGTDANGTADFGNAGAGVFIFGSNNTIGGMKTGEACVGPCNLISGNNNPGVYIVAVPGFNPTGNLVQGNYIGTDVNGTADLGNTIWGVYLNGGPSNTVGGTSGVTPGGPCTGACNVISGNNRDGVYIRATANQVQGNYIGTDVNGMADLGNSQNGVLLDGAGSSNMIGGAVAGARNVISGNNSNGVEINGGINLTGNQVQGNFIGTQKDGTSALGNTLRGVYILGSVSNNTVGGTVGGTGNTIAFNGGAGVNVDSAAGTRNAIRGNSIFNNSGLGIDLGTAGVTANDATDSDSGPNNLQNFPVLTSAVPGATTTIAGSINSAGGGGNNATYPITIEFFSSKVCNGDVNGTAATTPSDFGEGQTFLGSTTVPAPSGPSPFTFTGTSLSPVPVGHTVVTATATDANGNTSEFSKCLPINQPPVAKCKDVTVPAGPNCMASASINDGSFDPDPGDTITLSQSPPGLYPLGTTKVTLTVSDGKGGTSMCMANVTVTNAAPTANAGPDQTVNSGVTVTLNGAASTDPGQPLTYLWTQKAGTTVTLNNANTPTPTFTAPKTCSPSPLTFELKVTDPCGAMATDTMDVAVNPPACYPLPANNVLWLTGDNTANDISGQNNHGTLQGGATYDPSGKVQQAFSFDGTNDHVEVENHTSLNPGTGGFTVDAWIKADSQGGPDQPIIDKSSDFGNGYKLVIAGGKLGFQAGGAGGAFGNPTLIDGQWHHVALALNPNPPLNYFLYLDGKEITSGGMSSYNVDSALDLWIGRSHSSPTFFRGFIDEVEIFKGTLTGDKIKAIYDADCAGKCKDVCLNPPPCVPPPSGMINWWPGDGNANDIVGGKNGTLQDNATFATGKVDQAFSFDGNGDFVSLPANPAWNFGTGPFTIDFWARSSSSTRMHALSLGTYSFQNLEFDFNDGSGLWVYWNSSGANKLTVGSPGAYTDGQWHFFALTRSGTTMTLYVDGSPVGSATYAPAIDVSNVGFRYIGASALGYTGLWKGEIDEVEVFNRALDPGEIKKIFDADCSGKCKTPGPSCVNPPQPQNMIAWWSMDETTGITVADITGKGNNGTHMAGATPAPSGVVPVAGKVPALVNSGALKFSTSAANFIEATDDPLDVGTGELTIDAWVQVQPFQPNPDNPRIYPIVDKLTNFFLAGGVGYSFILADGKLGFVMASQGATQIIPISNQNVADGSWHHVAVTVKRNDASGGVFYDNGKPVGTFSTVGQTGTLSNQEKLLIGRWRLNDSFFNGNIDEVEIFNVALTQAEIQSISDAGSAGKCKDIKGTPDLMTTKTHTGDFIAGQNGVYTITVKNVGSGPAASPIMVTDTLPVGVLYVSDSGSPWSCAPSTVPPNPQTVKCTYSGPALQPGDSTPPLNLTVNILPAVIFLEPKITNCVEITSPKDANADNDKACDSTTVVLPPDLKITKTASPNPVVVGSKLTYTITVMNSGPNAATSVVVTDTLPTNATYVAGSCTATNGGDCSSFGSNGKVTFASLAANTSATITFMVTVNCSVADGATISNTASVASSLPDLDPSNNSATVAVTAKSTPPTANAGPDQVVNSGQAVMLDGSNSSPSGSLTYQWTQIGQPVVNLTNPTAAKPTFTAPPTCSPLMLTFQLKVTTDPCGAMATDTVVVTVNPTSCTPAPSGLVEWLSFDEARGPRANDLSGQGNHGTHTNAPTPFANGKVAGALEFDGTNDYVVVSDDASLDFGFGSFTIDTWIYPDATNAIRPIVDKRRGPSSTPRGYTLYLFNGRLGIQLANGTTFTNFETPSGTVVPVGQWTHVAAVVDRTKEFKVKLYINGKEVFTSTNILPGDISNTAPLWIGRNQIDAGYFDGKIDELEIFNRALDPITEIKPIHDADCAGKCKTPPRAPDLMITKSHAGTFKPGQTAVYTITVKNVGNLPSSGQTKVTDTLPPGLTYVSGTGAGWGCTPGTATSSGQTVTCTNNGSLAANASSTITLTVTVSSTISLPPNLSNCVSVETQNDSNLANNTFCDPTDITTCLNPVPSNMTNWWPGDGNANDIRGSNNGTLQNGTTFAAGKVAQAFKFDGVDDFVTFGNTIGNFGTSDFTIDFWIQTTSTRNEAILEKRAACSHASFVEFRLNIPPNIGKLFISIDQDGAGTNYNELITNKTVNDGLPHHVALVRQGTTATVYIDGQLDKSGTTSGVTNITNAASFTTGKSVCGSSAAFTGLLDEIEVFNRALSQPEIENIYKADSAGKCKPGGPPPGGSPDFVVQDLQVAPPGTPGGTVPGSSTVMVTFKIRNQGTTFAGGAQHQVLLIASPYTPTTGTVVATVLTEPLAAGAVSDTFKVTVQLPPGASPAIAARIRVVADSGNVVIELIEANNTSDFSFRIQ